MSSFIEEAAEYGYDSLTPLEEHIEVLIETKAEGSNLCESTVQTLKVTDY